VPKAGATKLIWTCGTARPATPRKALPRDLFLDQEYQLFAGTEVSETGLSAEADSHHQCCDCGAGESRHSRPAEIVAAAIWKTLAETSSRQDLRRGIDPKMIPLQDNSALKF